MLDNKPKTTAKTVKRIGKIVGAIAVIVVFLATSWLCTCGMIKAIALCFDLSFSLDWATGIWFICVAIGGIAGCLDKHD